MSLILFAKTKSQSDVLGNAYSWFLEFTSQFVVRPMAADDCFLRFLGTHFDPRAEER